MSQKHEAAISALKNEHDGAINVIRSQHTDEMKSFHADVEQYDREATKKHRDAIQNTKSKYEAILSLNIKERDQFVAMLETAIGDHQERHEEYCAKLQNSHDAAIARKDQEITDLKAKVEKTQSESLRAAGVSRISSLNAELFAATSKHEAYRREKGAEIAFLKSQNHALTEKRRAAEAQVKHLQNALPSQGIEASDKVVATMLAVSQVASLAAGIKENVWTETDEKLFDARCKIDVLKRIKLTLSHELEGFKAGNVRLMEDLDAAKDENNCYEQTMEVILSEWLEIEDKIDAFRLAVKAKTTILEKECGELAVDVVAFQNEQTD